MQVGEEQAVVSVYGNSDRMPLDIIMTSLQLGMNSIVFLVVRLLDESKETNQVPRAHSD